MNGGNKNNNGYGHSNKYDFGNCDYRDNVGKYGYRRNVGKYDNSEEVDFNALNDSDSNSALADVGVIAKQKTELTKKLKATAESMLDLQKQIAIADQALNEKLMKEKMRKENNRNVHRTGSKFVMNSRRVVCKSLGVSPNIDIRGKTVCSNCKKVGHGYWECRKPPIAQPECRSCNATDHNVRDCPEMFDYNGVLYRQHIAQYKK